MRVLRKTGEAHGILGKSILRAAETVERLRKSNQPLNERGFYGPGLHLKAGLLYRIQGRINRDHGKIKREPGHVRLGKDVSEDCPGKRENGI